VPVTRLSPTRGDATCCLVGLSTISNSGEPASLYYEKFIGKGAHLVVAGLVPVTRLSPTRGDATCCLVLCTISNSGELAPLYYQISRKWG
jgi:hypothetical protein